MLLLYVDDIVVIGNSSEFIAEIVTGLGKEFAMNYLGPLHFFLCIKVRYFNGSITSSITRIWKEALQANEPEKLD